MVSPLLLPHTNMSTGPIGVDDLQVGVSATCSRAVPPDEKTIRWPSGAHAGSVLMGAEASQDSLPGPIGVHDLDVAGTHCRVPPSTQSRRSAARPETRPPP